MDILVLNTGSSSLRFELVETSLEQIERDDDHILARGSVQKIGTAEAIVTVQTEKKKHKSSEAILTHADAIQAVASAMREMPGEWVRHRDHIEGVGHRIVHGGERFAGSTLIDDDVLHEIEEAIELAPLHNPHNLKGYHAARERLPHAKHVAVFDTSFHQTLPPRAYMYALPYVLYDRYKIRRYGFHGTSHRYVSHRYGQLIATPRDRLKLITCHLGNGCSVCAIDHGKPVDTSMGFTPLEGLVMGTRSGDVDPAAVLHVMAHEGMDLPEISSLLNKQSGLYGLSGLSNDMRALLEHAREGNERARLAIDVFCYRVKKYIGSYYAALNGADAVIFAGGIGENAPSIRARICEDLGALGIEIDAAKNDAAVGSSADISADGSRCKVWVVPTDEELLIARDTLRCILGRRQTE